MLKNYTNEKNILILISLLKEHGIKKVIVSPGTTNISFVASIQQDSWFEIFSAVDERSAAFMACGMAEESNEIVVLTCTGATASRNYIPGLTEAYYRHLPIIAVTATQNINKVGQYVAQVVDRSVQFKDLVKMSAQLSIVNSKDDENYCVRKVNEAILETIHGTKGPVHLNLETFYSNDFSVKRLPTFRKIERLYPNDKMPKLPNGKIGIYIWSHAPFSNEEIKSIEKFCEMNNAVVICDLVSNYHGKYRFLGSLVNSQSKNFGTKNFDLIITVGSVHGTYLPLFAKEEWRVNPDGIIRDKDSNLTKVFEMEEKLFFDSYSKGEKRALTFIELCNNAIKCVTEKIPDLPFSNMWIAKETSPHLIKDSILHLGILNSLRCWNYFDIDSSINCYTNSGGYGIDGCLSSFIGACYKHEVSLCYLVIGDLSFFYDINGLLNEIPSNARILVINNGIGMEFKNYMNRAFQFGSSADDFIAAKNHNGFKNQSLLKNLCREAGIKYLSACTKDEYIIVKEEWLKKDNKPVLLEAFIDEKDENKALLLMNNICNGKSLKQKLKGTFVWRIAKKLIRRG